MYTVEMTTVWNGIHKRLIQPHLHHHKVLKFEKKHRKDDAIKVTEDLLYYVKDGA